jgi:hypothetical protein
MLLNALDENGVLSVMQHLSFEFRAHDVMADSPATVPQWKTLHTSKARWDREEVFQMAQFVIDELPEACNRKPSTNEP